MLRTLFYVIVSSILLAWSVAADVSGLYWTDPGSVTIHRAAADGSNPEVIVRNEINRPVGFALEAESGKMYWTDEATFCIRRSDIDGSNVETIVEGTMGIPRSLVLDQETEQIFWISQGDYRGPGSVQRADFDGTNVTTLLNLELQFAGGIAIDRVGQHVFVAIGAFSFASIQRLDYNGLNAVPVVSSGLQQPNALRYDEEDGLLYWADRLGSSIHRVRSDGTNLETLITGAVAPRGIAINRDAGKLYWTSLEAVYEANIADGSGVELLVSTGFVDSLVDSVPEAVEYNPILDRIYWADSHGGALDSVSTDGSNPQRILERALSNPNAIRYDRTTQEIFWTDNAVGVGRIRSAHDDGSGLRDRIILPFRSPTGLGIDRRNEMLYWSDTTSIHRAGFEGEAAERLILAGSGMRGITIDPSSNSVYWVSGTTFMDFPIGGIHRADLADGGNRQLLRNTGSSGGLDIAVDAIGGQVYWTDTFTRTIERANIDGSGHQIIVSDPSAFPTGLALDPPSETLYWTDASAGKIQAVDLGGMNQADIVTGLIAPRGIALETSTPDLAATGTVPGTLYDAFLRVSQDGLGTELVGAVNAGSGLVKDIAVDPIDGTIYTIGFDTNATGQQLYVVDEETGAGVPLPESTGIAPPAFIWGLAFDSAGNLYGGGLGVYVIDKSSGHAELLADFEYVPAYILGMAGNPVDGRIWSTGILILDDLELPYVGPHNGDGALDADAIHFTYDSIGRERILFDIAFNRYGRCYGAAWSPGLFDDPGAIGASSDLVQIGFETAANAGNINLGRMSPGIPSNSALFGLGGPLPESAPPVPTP